MLKRSKNEEKNTKKMVKLKKKKTLNAKIANTKIEIPSEEFDQLVEKIKRRNSARSYPEINDIPK